MMSSEFDTIMERLDYMERRFDRLEKLFQRMEYGIKHSGRFEGAPNVPHRPHVPFQELEVR